MRQSALANHFGGRIATGISEWWNERHNSALHAAAAIMFLAALVWLSYEFWRLLWQQGRWGAIDLRIYQRLVLGWFAGNPIYAQFRDAVHPPATYAIVWPLLGWLPFTSARWLWAATTLPMLGWLTYLVVRESGADSRSERLFVALVPCSMYATGAAIGNGQLIIHILPVLVAGLLFLRERQRPWHTDLLIASLILLAFVKPSISVPFFWIVLFVAHSLWPALLVGIGYLAVTLFAASFQKADLATLIQQWTSRSSALAVEPGYGNVSNLHIWLATLGLNEWILPISVLVLVALGTWIYYYRDVDLWLLLGVTGYVTRYWTYHRWYDDLLILLPMVAMFAIAKQRPTNDGTGVLAGILLAVTMLAMLAPGGLFLFPTPWDTLYVVGQNMVWISGLGFLIYQAARDKNAPGRR